MLYSVRGVLHSLALLILTSKQGSLCLLCKHLGQNICSVCETQWNTRDQNGARRVCHSEIHGRLDSAYKVIGTGKNNHDIFSQVSFS